MPAGDTDNAANDVANVVAIAKLPYYRGNSKDTLSAHAWLDAVDRAATLNKWDAKLAAGGAADALREGANTWRENLQAGSVVPQR